MSTPSTFRTAQPSRVCQSVRFCALLIGLPAMLYLLLAISRNALGSGLAVVATLMVGVWLSAFCPRHRVPNPDAEPGVDQFTR